VKICLKRVRLASSETFQIFDDLIVVVAITASADAEEAVIDSVILLQGEKNQNSHGLKMYSKSHSSSNGRRRRRRRRLLDES
jgi:hypothetical protein